MINKKERPKFIVKFRNLFIDQAASDRYGSVGYNHLKKIKFYCFINPAEVRDMMLQCKVLSNESFTILQKIQVGPSYKTLIKTHYKKNELIGAIYMINSDRLI